MIKKIKLKFLILLAITFILISCSKNVISEPIELNVSDSILGTCTSVAAQGGILFGTFDALSKQVIQAWDLNQPPETSRIGHIVREGYDVRAMKIFDNYLVLVEGQNGGLFFSLKDDNYQAVGRLIKKNDEDFILFDIEVYDSLYYCAGGENGVLVFKLIPNQNDEILRFELVDSLQTQGSISHIDIDEEIIVASSWNKKIIYIASRENIEILNLIKDLPSISGIEIVEDNLFVACESNGLYIYDISDLSDISLKNIIDTIPAYEILYDERFIFISSDVQGVNIFDKEGSLIAYCSSVSPAERLAVSDTILFVTHAGMIPKGFIWFVDIKPLVE